MFHHFDHRAGHYTLLLAAAAALFLINLGGPSLWDIDEGNNAECAREMLERENWVVPTCNYDLRIDKPALLYWLQIAAYQRFGVNEFSARLPSALAALLAVLLTYELGRMMFAAAVGLLAGLALASTTLFCASAHFANPDALLSACTVLTLLLFWLGCARAWRWWFVPAGASAGLAVLAKGPVGLVLPGLIALAFLLWSRRLRLLLDRRLVLGLLAFLLVAAPWYAWVGEQTKIEFLKGFFFKHNVGRYLSPMENHRGPVFYYLAVLMVGFVPWSVFFGLAAWDVIRTLRGKEASPPSADARPAVRFLVCWGAVYLAFFSLSGTKLPNYILPMAAPMAILTARFLDRWRSGATQPPTWALRLSLGTLAFVGIAVGIGLLAASGVFAAPLLRGRVLPGLEAWAAVGLVPLAGAAMAGWCLRRGDRRGVVAVFTLAAVLFVGIVAAHGGITLDAHKAPKPIARVIHHDHTEPDIRVATYQYFQPSLIFYCERKVERLLNEREALDFLRYPVPVYLVAPARVWERLEARSDSPCRLLSRHRDFYRNCDVVVVTNR